MDRLWEAGGSEQFIFTAGHINLLWGLKRSKNF